MDKIHIKNLEVYAHHGVFSEEKTLGQRFLVSAKLKLSTRRAGKTGDLKASVHYGEVCVQIERFMKEHTYSLLETAAEELAEELLLSRPLLREVTLEIKKPWAPIGLPLETVSVEITRGWHTAYIALGSNMGDKKAYLCQAVEALRATRELRVKQISEWMVTKPYGGVEQEDFLNGVMEIETILPPGELLMRMQELETAAHRERLIHWGPRTLDLDMLFYDDDILQLPELILPHPDLENRDFVLSPMAEIAPYFRHPVSGKTIRQLKKELEERD